VHCTFSDTSKPHITGLHFRWAFSWQFLLRKLLIRVATGGPDKGIVHFEQELVDCLVMSFTVCRSCRHE
jgi:hypothetical protein